MLFIIGTFISHINTTNKKLKIDVKFLPVFTKMVRTSASKIWNLQILLDRYEWLYIRNRGFRALLTRMIMTESPALRLEFARVNTVLLIREIRSYPGIVFIYNSRCKFLKIQLKIIRYEAVITDFSW